MLAATEARSRECDLAFQQAEVAVWQGLALRRLDRADEAGERFAAGLALARDRGYHRVEERAAAALAALRS